MKNEFDFRFLNKIMYVAAAIAIFYVCKNLGIVDMLLKINSALIPVYIGIVICFLGMPISRRFRKWGIDKKWAALFSIIIIYAIIAILIALIVPVFVKQIGDLITNFPSIYTSIVTKINDFMHTTLKISEEYSISTDFKELNYMDFINKFKDDMVGYSITTVQSVGSFLVKFITVIVISFFLVKDMEDINKKVISKFSKNGKDKKRYRLITSIEDAVGSYVKGMVIDSIIVGILTTVLCFVLKLNYALVFGLLITILNFIPYFGAVISELIIALYAMTVGGPLFGVLTFALCLGIQLLDSNVLQPNIVAKSVDLHPALVFVGLIIGDLLFGMWGMLLAIPIIAIIKVIIVNSKDDIKEKIREKIIE